MFVLGKCKQIFFSLFQYSINEKSIKVNKKKKRKYIEFRHKKAKLKKGNTNKENKNGNIHYKTDGLGSS